MKITFVLPGGGLAGGIRVAAVYAERLVRRGHDVHAVWERFAPPTRLARLRALRRGKWLRPRAQGSEHFDGIPVTQSIAAEPGPVRDRDLPDADIVVATWWETAFAVAALSPAKGEKVYFVQHHEVHDHLPDHLSRGSYHLPLHKITISQWLAETMAAEYGDHDVDVVPNSVDLDLFHAAPREKNRVPTVGLLYSRSAPKGVDLTLEAIERARHMLPDLQVVAFGAHPLKAHLPLPKDAHYFERPPQETLRDIYAMCDVWVVGSRSEGFGLPLLEAMACRTPVVSTRTGAAPELIEDGVNGFVVDVVDVAALGRRIAEVAALAPADWRRMSDAAFALARSYSWDDATEAFEAALLRRVGPPTGRRASGR